MSDALKLERFVDGLGLRHFKGRELTPYWSRKRGDVSNGVPPEVLWPNVVPVLVVLDEIRERLGYGVRITSSYRSPAYNRAVGGEPNSFHMRFAALDWQGERESARAWHAAAVALRGKRLALPGNGQTLIFRGGIGRYGTFVHVDARGYDADWRG